MERLIGHEAPQFRQIINDNLDAITPENIFSTVTARDYRSRLYWSTLAELVDHKSVDEWRDAMFHQLGDYYVEEPLSSVEIYSQQLSWQGEDASLVLSYFDEAIADEEAKMASNDMDAFASQQSLRTSWALALDNVASIYFRTGLVTDGDQVLKRVKEVSVGAEDRSREDYGDWARADRARFLLNSGSIKEFNRMWNEIIETENSNEDMRDTLRQIYTKAVVDGKIAPKKDIFDIALQTENAVYRSENGLLAMDYIKKFGNRDEMEALIQSNKEDVIRIALGKGNNLHPLFNFLKKMQVLRRPVRVNNFLTQLESLTLSQLDHDISLSYFSLLYGYASLGWLGDMERFYHEAQGYIANLTATHRTSLEAYYLLALGRAGDIDRIAEVVDSTGVEQQLRFKSYGLVGRLLAGESIQKLLPEIRKIILEDTKTLEKPPMDINYEQQRRMHGEWAHWLLKVAMTNGFRKSDFKGVKKIIELKVIPDENVGDSLCNFYQNALGITPVMLDSIYELRI
jgi:hypothetical protein